MFKKALFGLTLAAISAVSLAGESMSHSTCSKYVKGRKIAIKLVKGKHGKSISKNKLFFAIDTNADCTFPQNVTVTPFWWMGEEASGSTVKCEDPSGLESGKLDLNNSDTTYISSQKAKLKFRKFSDLGKNYTGGALSSNVYVSLSGSKGNCKIKVKTTHTKSKVSQSFYIKTIDLKYVTTFGLPTGVNYVTFEGYGQNYKSLDLKFVKK